MKVWQAPLIAAQSLYVRNLASFLPDPSGPRQGTVAAPGRPSYRLGVVGESTAASVGADSHERGIPGALARSLAAGTQRQVEWCVSGCRRATIRRVRHKLIPQLPPDLDLVVLLVGVNDVFGGVPIDEWGIDIAVTVEDLAVRNGHVVVSGIPPLSSFPCLPRSLARHLDERARRMDQVTEEVCAAREGVTFAANRELFEAHPEFMFAPDGFHPSQECYELWAGSMARLVLS